jgi:gluconate 2-dehydrogenase subunit 3-like protein
MKRRRFLKAMVAAPTAPALFAQQLPAPSSPAPVSGTPVPTTAAAPAVAELPKLESTVADAAAEVLPGFFNTQQFAALRKLSDILMPSLKGQPGALETGAPEFLDFLIGSSPADRQQVYRTGLDALNAQAKKRFERPFSELDTTQAEVLLAPLRQPWTYEPPADPLARFLRAAKQDVRTATVNSREGSSTSASSGRRGGGTGQYWYPIE